MAEEISILEKMEHLRSTADRSRQWLAARTVPRHEKRVHVFLAERGIEAFLPLYRTLRQWKKSAPAVLELPLFPTYIFVKCGRFDRAAVLDVPGVLSIVGSQNIPWPLPDADIEALKRAIQTYRVEPHAYLKCGEKVRIKTGLLSGVQGVLLRRKNDYRVIVTLDMIMRSVSIEVDCNDVEAINPIAV